MASTRSKNTPGNYALEQDSLLKIRQYEVYTGYRFNDQTCLPGRGLLPARLPFQLFDRTCDIESELLGIGATNLVQPPTGTLLPPANQGWTTLNMVPATPVVIPEPLVMSMDQRFGFH
jgi:hypothetical protein